MYRVFEALDELVTICEEARGVPMTTSCVVSRGDILELLDDVREAIPGELDDAQDVLDHRDQLVAEATEEADKARAQTITLRTPPETPPGTNYFLDMVSAEAKKLATDLANGPTFGNAMTKRMLEMEWAMSVETAVEAEAVAQALCMETEDFARAFRAFAAKQRPVFEGN